MRKNQESFPNVSADSTGSSLTRRNLLIKTGQLIIASSVPGLGWGQAGSARADDVGVSPAVSRREINIGTFGPSHCATSFVYTKLKGLFAQDKLPVNLVNYPNMQLIAKDLIGGKLDFGQLIVPMVFAINTGSKPFEQATPMVITQIAGTNGAALMVRKGSGISQPADFKGKTMANHSKLSVHYLINMMFLESYGLDYLKDVNFKVVELEKIVAAMKDGELDTFVMPEPQDAMVEDKGIGDVFMLSKYIWPNHPCCSLVVRKDFYEGNRQLVTDVTRTMTKGALLANEPATRGEIIDLLQSTSDYNYDKIPKPVLLKAFTPGRSDFYPFPYQSTARVIIEIMKRHDLLPKEVKDAELARSVFLSGVSRQVMKELGANPPESDFRAEKILGQVREYQDQG